MVSSTFFINRILADRVGTVQRLLNVYVLMAFLMDSMQEFAAAGFLSTRNAPNPSLDAHSCGHPRLRSIPAGNNPSLLFANKSKIAVVAWPRLCGDDPHN
jgi:hypothetical protein